MTFSEALFENGVFPVIQFDYKKGTILRANSLFRDWFRIKNLEETELDWSRARGKPEDLLLGDNQPAGIPLSVKHGNGNFIPCMAAIHRIDDPDGDYALIILHESEGNCEEQWKLRSRSANLSTLSESMVYPFWSVDSRLNLMDCNRLFLQLAEETLGKPVARGDSFTENFEGFMGISWQDRYEKAARGEPADYRDSFAGKNLQTTVLPIISEYGEVMGICTTMKDVTEEQNLLNRFNSILNSSAEAAIIATDREGIIRQFNQGASAMLGYSTEEITGSATVEKLFSNAFLRTLENYIRRETGNIAERGEILLWFSRNPGHINNLEWHFLHREGGRISVKISISRVLTGDNSFGGILIIAQDITELKRIREELEIARMQAEETSRTKTSFLANMSHEIRTPLNGIIGMADLLNRSEMSVVQKTHLSVILKSANTLLLLINDILDYTRIESGKFTLGSNSFSLDILLDDIRDMLGVNQGDRNITYSINRDREIGDTLIGDSRRLRQILLNLVGNAMKFTIEGSIDLEIRQIFQSGSAVTLYFEVRDTGIGISPEDRELLFRSFSQVDTSETRKYGGSGLGLAISRELVLMMGGEIGMESTPGKGSVFWFTVRLEKDPVLFRGRKVLIAGEDSAGLKRLERMLEKYHIPADRFSRADEMKDGENYDVLFIDDSFRDHITGTGEMPLVRTTCGTDRDLRDFQYILKLPVQEKELEDCLNHMFRHTPEGLDEKAEKELPPGESADERNITVLIAEDNKINQLVIMNFMKKLGYNADLVENGEQAVRACREKSYEIILMDQMMPLMDGIAATEEIRKPGSGNLNRDVKIIALTANAMKGDREILMEAGMDDYIPKPVLLKDIKEILERNLMKGEQERR